MSNLTPIQNEAASGRGGKIVVTAGPGSGKTRVAVARIEAMIAEGASASSFCAVTFTTRAADELVARLRRPIGFCGTIHGLCYRLLQMAAGLDGSLRRDFGIWDEIDREEVLSSIQRARRLRTNAKAAQGLLDAKHFEGGDPVADLRTPPTPAHVDLYILARLYRERKAAYNVEDFNGLVDRARAALLGHPELLEAVRSRWHHLIVDEYQDVDAAQNDLFATIWPESDTTPEGVAPRSVFIVGDPLQSLYRWRGGDPGLLMERGGRADRRVYLCENFRSRPGIVKALQGLADRDPWHGHIDQLKPTREKTASGGIWVKRLENEAAEDEEIVALIRGWPAPVVLHDFAILCRTRYQVGRIRLALEAAGIRHVVLGDERERMRGEGVRTALAYLRLAVSPADDHSFRRAWAFPPRVDVGDELEAAAGGGSLLEGLANLGMSGHHDVAAFLKVHDDLRLLRTSSTWDEPVEVLLQALRNAYAAAGMASRVQDLDFLRGRLRAFKLKEQEAGRMGYWPSPDLGAFVRWLQFRASGDEYQAGDSAVTLSTVHLAKGLEWRVVFLPGWSEGILPSRQAVEALARGDGAPLVDERRAAYVALSRAQELAVVLSPQHVTLGPWDDVGDDAAPSRFIEETSTLAGDL